MNAKDFFEEVSKMRDYQKEYFRTRSSLALKASMKQEKLIDEEIRRVRGILGKKNEKDLFNSPEAGERI